MVMFNATTAGLRWDHLFSVCAGDLIPDDFYEGGVMPEFYLARTGQFMKVYCFFYVGVFLIVSSFGFLISLWITYKTTFTSARLTMDPEYIEED